jgi:hypothetical protein
MNSNIDHKKFTKELNFLYDETSSMLNCVQNMVIENNVEENSPNSDFAMFILSYLNQVKSSYKYTNEGIYNEMMFLKLYITIEKFFKKGLRLLINNHNLKTDSIPNRWSNKNTINALKETLVYTLPQKDKSKNTKLQKKYIILSSDILKIMGDLRNNLVHSGDNIIEFENKLYYEVKEVLISIKENEKEISKELKNDIESFLNTKNNLNAKTITILIDISRGTINDLNKKLIKCSSEINNKNRNKIKKIIKKNLKKKGESQ